MNAKTSIAVTLVVCGILLTGLTVLTDQPPTVFHITITIPAWLRAAGAATLFGAIIFWLRRDLWIWIAEPMDTAAAWLSDDEVR